ncbi:heavy metal translocating P-type ATPase [Halobacillus campisalis]|uniref:Cd(2+)-exporting ATPase n=1 Tax=Halobacillus campisalis TaxID=435909 RepID=A0ABW2K5K1_9BACI|nr:heavy metal translocating P-type ATPase [Halobacillus campisalis]
MKVVAPMSEQTEKTYYVEGFSCAGCAGTFEKNVKNIRGVDHAEVNFAASKITVSGDVTVQQLEKAGAFEKLSVREDQSESPASSPHFFSKYFRELLAAFFLIVAYTVLWTAGEPSIYTTGLFIAAILTGGTRLFITGLQNLSRATFDMRTLMTLAIIGASILGEWGEAAVVVILFAISEALESNSMNKARESIRTLFNMAPDRALVRRNGVEQEIASKEIIIGDTLLIKPGQKIPVDGEISLGNSSINQAAITGESIPVQKGVGDEVFAGTLNEHGYVEVTASSTSSNTKLAKIIELVEKAQSEKAPSQHFVDRFAHYYTPAIIVVAVITAVLPPLLLGAEWSTWIYQGLAVLVVGCPCALVISTPVSIVTAIGNAAKNGVLIKGGVYLEQAGTIQTVAFDKTGTLTKGFPEVADVHHHLGNPAENMAWIAAIEKYSHHPLASAIVKKAESDSTNYNLPVEEFESMTGRGVKGQISGKTYYVGSPSLFHGHLNEDQSSLIEKWQAEGHTVIAAGTAEALHTLLAIKDRVRKESREIVQRLHEIGINRTTMLTGDNKRTAQSLAEEIGISDYQAELLPEQKLEAIEEYRKKYGKIMMIGDGVNDAPALATADIGTSLGGAGTDTALETADIVFMKDDLSKLPFTIRLSRHTLSIIKQNITFSIAIKLVALLLVIPGWLTLWIAIFADMGATILVTLNSLRLLKHR